MNRTQQTKPERWTFCFQTFSFESASIFLQSNQSLKDYSCAPTPEWMVLLLLDVYISLLSFFVYLEPLSWVENWRWLSKFGLCQLDMYPKKLRCLLAFGATAPSPISWFFCMDLHPSMDVGKWILLCLKGSSQAFSLSRGSRFASKTLRVAMM